MSDTSTNGTDAVFIITSATNAPYHAINSRPAATDLSESENTAERDPGQQDSDGYEDLLATIASIHRYAPQSRIALVEYSAYPLEPAQHDALIQLVDYVMDYSGNEHIQHADRSLGTHADINAFSQLSCLRWFLQIGAHHRVFDRVQRICKIAPGTLLTADIHATAHFARGAANKYVFPNATLATASAGAIPLQFSNDYWSLDTRLLPQFIETLATMSEALNSMREQGSAIPVESLLYKYIDARHIFYDLSPAVTARASSHIAA